MDTEAQCVIDCIMTSLVSHIHELWLNSGCWPIVTIETTPQKFNAIFLNHLA